MTLRIKDCKATPSTIRVFFTEDVQATDPNKNTDATHPGNYTLVTPIGNTPQAITTTKITYDPFQQAVYIPLTNPPKSLSAGTFVGIIVSNVETPLNDKLPGPPPGGIANVPNSDRSVTRVNGGDDEEKDIRRIARVTEDSFAFPQLSEEIGYPPSPLARPSGAPS